MASASEIAEIRLLSGDDISGQYIVSDDIISSWYDDNTSICATVVKVLRARMAHATKTIGSSGEGQTTNPKVAQIQALLDIMRADCPQAIDAPSVSYLNLGIDEETDIVDIEQ